MHATELDRDGANAYVRAGKSSVVLRSNRRWLASFLHSHLVRRSRQPSQDRSQGLRPKPVVQRTLKVSEGSLAKAPEAFAGSNAWRTAASRATANQDMMPWRSAERASSKAQCCVPLIPQMANDHGNDCIRTSLASPSLRRLRPNSRVNTSNLMRIELLSWEDS